MDFKFCFEEEWIRKHEKAKLNLRGLTARKKHNRLNVGRIALERLVGALINCSLLQSVGGLNGTKKFNSGLLITTLEVNIYHLRFKVKMAPVSAHLSFDF